MQFVGCCLDGRVDGVRARYIAMLPMKIKIPSTYSDEDLADFGSAASGGARFSCNQHLGAQSFCPDRLYVIPGSQKAVGFAIRSL